MSVAAFEFKIQEFRRSGEAKELGYLTIVMRSMPWKRFEMKEYLAVVIESHQFTTLDYNLMSANWKFA